MVGLLQHVASNKREYVLPTIAPVDLDLIAPTSDLMALVDNLLWTRRWRSAGKMWGPTLVSNCKVSSPLSA